MKSGSAYSGRMNVMVKVHTFYLMMVCSLVLLLWVPGVAHAQFVADNAAFLQRFGQQKVYLHTDKEQYFAGDQIWFKAWVAQAHTHKPDTVEDALYVELVRDNGELLRRRIIRISEGMGEGSIRLHDSLPEGNYRIRAYTQWMLNFDRDFIFIRDVFVYNPESKNFISRSLLRENRRKNREMRALASQYNLSFFPEGGKMLNGLPVRVGFFASNSLGKGVTVDGVLLNERNDTLAILKSENGYGVFEFTPEVSSRYQVRASLNGSGVRQFQPGRIDRSGLSIRVDRQEDALSLQVRGAGATTKDTLFLVVHTRGVIARFEKISSENLPFNLHIRDTDLPSGISAASLFDSRGRNISERLFFVFPSQTDTPSVLQKLERTGQAVRVQLKLPFAPSDTLGVSLSLTGANAEFDPLDHTGMHHFLLRSDLPFSSYAPVALMHNHDAMDQLMLSAGWKRFEIQKTGPGQEPDIHFVRHEGFPVFGRIEPTRQSRELGMLDFEVTLQSGEEERMKISKADREGNFRFEGMDFEGDFEAEITVLGLRGSNASLVEVFPDQLAYEPFKPNYNFRALPQSRGSAWQRVTQPRFPTSQRTVNLGENLRYHHGSPDQIIYLRETDIRFSSMRDVLLRGTSGITIDGNQILIRGISSLMLSNQPLLLVDGQEYSSFQFLSLSPLEISHVEIYKGTSAAIFGLRGANGVIVAHSRRSNLPLRHIFQYVLTGFHVSEAFSRDVVNPNETFPEHPKYVRTLAWKPYLEWDEQGISYLEIPVDKSYHSLRLVIEGLSKEGNILHLEEIIRDPAEN